MAAVRRMALGEFRWTRHNLQPSAVVRATVLAADVTVTDGPSVAAPANSASCASLPPSLIWFSAAGRRLLADGSVSRRRSRDRLASARRDRRDRHCLLRVCAGPLPPRDLWNL